MCANHPPLRHRHYEQLAARIEAIRTKSGRDWCGKENGGSLRQVVLATVKHQCGVVLDEGKGMTVKIAEHCVAAPAAYYSNFIGVNPPQEQGHSPTTAEGAGSEFLGVYAAVAWNGVGSRSKDAGDHGGRDGSSFSVFKVDVEGCVCGGIVATEVDDSAHGCPGWTGERLTIGSMCKFFALDPVLLS